MEREILEVGLMYLLVIGSVAIAGILAAKKRVPEGAGSLKVDTGTFGVMVFAGSVLMGRDISGRGPLRWTTMGLVRGGAIRGH